MAAVAAPAMAPSAPHLNIDERAGAAAEDDQLHPLNLHAAEEHSDQTRPTHTDDDGVSAGPPPQSSPSSAARESVAINPDASPEASAANTRDRLDTGDGSHAAIRIGGLSVEPVSNLVVPVAHADVHREPTGRSIGQSIDV